MAYTDLSAEQKAAVDSLTNFVRATSGEIARLSNHGRAVANLYSGNVETILSGLQAGDLIPNAGGLAGAQSLTKSELVNLIGYMIDLSATADNSAGSYNTNYHRGLYAKAAGINNLVG